jgi:hypothetical protein
MGKLEAAHQFLSMMDTLAEFSDEIIHKCIRFVGLAPFPEAMDPLE